MDLSKININTLREMLKLSERKEKLLNELKNLEDELIAHLSGCTSEGLQQASKKGKENASTQKEKSDQTPRQRASRGTMKAQILEALTEAGAAGIKVPDLAKKIGVKSANVHVWFSNVGKKLPEIERIGAGCFRIRQ